MGFCLAAIIGLIAGCCARTAMPGPNPMGIVGTIVLGIAGASIGYFIGTLIGGTVVGVDARSLLLAVIGSFAVLFCYRANALRYAD